MWYPEKKEELNKLLDSYKKTDPKIEVHGIIVPHAGYIFSGEIASKAYFSIKPKPKAIILAPSHYIALRGLATHNKDFLKTPLGKIKISKNILDLKELDLTEEHAINNQIPFLQKIGITEIYPIMIGEISLSEAENYSQQLKDLNALIIVSSDLSHFLNYNQAVQIDKTTIKNIEKLETKNIDACGIFPLLIAINLCKIKHYQPKLIEYKNSGDITRDKSRVVGYAAMYF